MVYFVLSKLVIFFIGWFHFAIFSYFLQQKKWMDCQLFNKTVPWGFELLTVYDFVHAQ